MYKICISRTDGIGDVVLTLPIVGFLRENLPDSEIHFLGRAYTLPILERSRDIDELIDFSKLESNDDEELIEFFREKGYTHFIHVFPNKRLARIISKARIPNRIGTSHRLFHFLTCNRKVNFTRKNSPLHESQLNFKLLEPLGFKSIPELAKMSEYLNFKNQFQNFDFTTYGLSNALPTIILHPKSKGSAVEWGVSNFISLIKLLENSPVQIVITGTEEESQFFRAQLPTQKNIVDLSGKLSLEGLVDLIQNSKVLVAASTGPLHIAGMFGIYAFGMFSSRRPIHPGRWQPLGMNSKVFVYDKYCNKCKVKEKCECISKIKPELIQQEILKLV